MEKKKISRGVLAAVILASLCLSGLLAVFWPPYRPSGVYEAVSCGRYLYGLDLKDQDQYIFRVDTESGESRRIRVPVYKNGRAVAVSSLTPLPDGETYVEVVVSGESGEQIFMGRCDFSRGRLETVRELSGEIAPEGFWFSSMFRSMDTVALTYINEAGTMEYYRLEDGDFSLYQRFRIPEGSYLADFTQDGAVYFLGNHGEIWLTGEDGTLLQVYDTGSTAGEGREARFRFYKDEIYFEDLETGQTYRLEVKGEQQTPVPCEQTYRPAASFDEDSMGMEIFDGKETKAGILYLEDGRQTAAVCGAHEYVAWELLPGSRARLLFFILVPVILSGGTALFLKFRNVLIRREIVIPLVAEAAVLSLALMAAGLGLLRNRVFSSIRQNAADNAMETCLQLAYGMRDAWDQKALQTMCGYDAITAENELPYGEETGLSDGASGSVLSGAGCRLYFQKNGRIYPLGDSMYVLNMTVDDNFVSGSPAIPGAVRQALAEQKAVTVEYSDLEGWQYGAFLPLKTRTGEYPVVLEAYMTLDGGNRIFAAQARPVEHLLFLMAAALLGAVLFTLWRGMRPVGLLKQAALQVARGQLGAEVRAKGRSEAAVTAVRFNRMSRQIASQVSGIGAYQEKYNAFVPLKFLETARGEESVQQKNYMVMTVGGAKDQASWESWIRRVHEKNGEVLFFEPVGLQCLFLGKMENALEAAAGILKDTGGKREVFISLGYEEVRLGITGDGIRSAVSAFGMNGDFNGFLKECGERYGASLLVDGPAAERIPGFFTSYHVRRLGAFFLERTGTAVAVYEVLDGEPEEDRRQKILTGELFSQGLRAFEAGDDLGARMAFIRVLAENGRDGAALQYVRLCEENLGRPSGERTEYMETYGSGIGSV